MNAGVVLFAIGVGGLVTISVGLIAHLFVMVIRERDWGTVLFLSVTISLTVMALVGMALAVPGVIHTGVL